MAQMSYNYKNYNMLKEIQLIEIKDGDFPKTETLTGTGEEYVVISKADGITYGIKTSDLKRFLGTVQVSAPIPLSPSDPAPTMDAEYKPTVSGPYPNAGGLTFDKEGEDKFKDVSFLLNDGEWFKYAVPMPETDVSGLVTKTEFEPIQDAVKITVSGTNMVDSSTLQSGSYNGLGNYAPSVNWLSIPPRAIRDRSERTLSGFGGVAASSQRVLFYRENGAFLSALPAEGSAVTTPISYTPPAEAFSEAFNVASGTGVGTDPANSPYKDTLMLNLGAVALPFEPFTGDKIDPISIDYDFSSIATDAEINTIQSEIDELNSKVDPLFVPSKQLSDNTLMQNRQLGSTGGYGGLSANVVSLLFQPIPSDADITLSGLGGVATNFVRYVIRPIGGEVITSVNGLGVINSNPVSLHSPAVPNLEIGVNVSSQSGSGTALVNGTSPFPGSFMMNEGLDALPFEPYGEVFDPSLINVTAKPEIVYVSINGNDDNTGISEATALRTLPKAQEIASPTAEIIVMEGDYIKPEFSLDDFRVLKAKTGDRVRFIYGNQITASTAVSGMARVRQAPYTSAIGASAFLWQHDIEDEATVIDILERSPLHRGRRTRLPSTRIYPAASIQEIQDTTDKLMYFAEGGVLYFSMVPGSNLAVNPIVHPLSTSISANKERLIEINNIDILYRPIRTTGLMGSISNVAVGMVNAAGAIVYDRSIGLKFYDCEAFGSSNDGTNGHVSGNASNPFPLSRFLQVTFFNLYSHDNYDDDDSCHEYSGVIHFGGLVEYSGNGVTPASGGHAICYNMTSRKHGSHPWSLGQAGTGYSSQGSSLDRGVSTTLECYNCISIDDGQPFRGVDLDTKYIQCISIRSGSPTPFGTGQKIMCYADGVLVND